MKSEKLNIINTKGNALNAYLELPANQKPNHFAIFAHCFTCSGSFGPVRNISRALTNHGFGVIRFDFTGLGNSEGEFAESHFSGNVDDLTSVHKYIKENYNAPSLLIGHSLGGAAVLTAASKLDDIKAVVTIAAPSTVGHVKNLFSHQLEDIPAKGDISVNIGGRPFVINKEFVDDFDKTDLLEIVKNLRKPLLIMHSPSDTIVGIENAEQLYKNARHPKSFISLDNADHLLSKKEDSVYRYTSLKKPSIIKLNDAIYFKDDFTDYSIAFPKANYINNRPDFLNSLDRKAVIIPYKFYKNVTFPILCIANNKNEPKDASPYDVIEIETMDKMKDLFLLNACTFCTVLYLRKLL